MYADMMKNRMQVSISLTTTWKAAPLEMNYGNRDNLC
jgi:hypothetical protein